MTAIHGTLVGDKEKHLSGYLCVRPGTGDPRLHAADPAGQPRNGTLLVGWPVSLRQSGSSGSIRLR